MGIHLVPLAVGAALSSVAIYLFRDEETRHRVVDESRQIGTAFNDYVSGFFSDEPKVATGHSTAITEHKPDTLRCEALAKTGERCRAKTNKVVNFPNTAGGQDEHGLCWRHARVFEQGDPLELAEAGPSNPEKVTAQH